MSLRTTFFLMLAFLVLGTFAIFDPLRRGEKEREREDREGVVYYAKDKKLLKIEMSTPAGEPVELQCARAEGCPFDGSGDWKLLRPVADDADPSTVGSAASQLAGLRVGEKLDFENGAIDPKEFGLDQPQATVKLHVQGEPEPTVLKFGKDAPVGSTVYVSSSRAPARLFLLPNYLPNAFRKDVFHWRNKRLFPSAQSGDLDRISWKAEKLSVRALREAGVWRLEAPAKARGADTMLEGLLSTIVYSAAKSVFAPGAASAEAKKALATRPLLEIEASGAGGKSLRLALYAKPGATPGRGRAELVARASGRDPLYLVEGTQFDRFTKPIAEYRQRSLLSAEQQNQVSEMKLLFPREKKEVSLKLENGAWVYVAGERPAEPLAQRRLTGFLDALRDADFKSFHAAGGRDREAVSYRTEPADLELELKGGGKTLLQKRFLSFDRKAVLVEDEGEVKELRDPLLRALPVRYADLYESNNKQVVVPPAAKEAGDGHDFADEPADDGHRH